ATSAFAQENAQGQTPAAQGTAGANQESAANAGATDSVEAIVVTGTRVAGRTRLETVAPVDVVTSQAISHGGTTELAPPLSFALPSVNFTRPAVTDGTDP